MAFITAITDVQDSTGKSVVVQNADGTRPSLVLKMGTGLSASYAVVGTQGVVSVTTPGISSGGIVLGSQVPPQAVIGVSPTVAVTTGESPVQVLSYPNPAPLATFADVGLIVRIPLASPGILLFARVQLIVVAGAYGTTLAVVATTQDTMRTSVNSPWISTAFTLTTSGSNVVLSAQAPTFQAFMSGGAYTGSIAAGSVPNALGDGTNSLVTNGGHLYVVTSGGTDSGTGGPTTTTPGSPQTVGGITYYYVGSASAGVTAYSTATLLAVETG